MNKKKYFCNTFFYALSFLLFFLSPCSLLISEDKKTPDIIDNKSSEPTLTPQKVDVKPVARDYEISQRLINILNSTGWFIDPVVDVKDGVVFLRGTAKSDEYKKWAGDLAHKTQDTVAIVNKIQVVKPSINDFQPLLQGLYEQWQSFLRTIPSIIFAFLILLITWLAAKLITYLSMLVLKKKLNNPLLQRIIDLGIHLSVFLIGLYTIAHLVGLTDIALTLIGGTGLFGIILGIAFKDITENLLASIFLSINNPFDGGDLIEINGITGFVQRLTLRTTILLTLEGVYVQIPNATVYKSNIINYTSNPNRRNDFTLNLDQNSSISDTQEIVLKILKEHPAVLLDPEPWVLVDSITNGKINLRIYFWTDGQKHSVVKVRSSLIRLIKNAFIENKIKLSDDVKERYFPDGLLVHLSKDKKTEDKISKKIVKNKNRLQVVTAAEGALNSEAEEIKEQALQSKSPEEGKDLLKKSKLNHAENDQEDSLETK